MIAFIITVLIVLVVGVVGVSVVLGGLWTIYTQHFLEDGSGTWGGFLDWLVSWVK